MGVLDKLDKYTLNHYWIQSIAPEIQLIQCDCFFSGALEGNA